MGWRDSLDRGPFPSLHFTSRYYYIKGTVQDYWNWYMKKKVWIILNLFQKFLKLYSLSSFVIIRISSTLSLLWPGPCTGSTNRKNLFSNGWSYFRLHKSIHSLINLFYEFNPLINITNWLIVSGVSKYRGAKQWDEEPGKRDEGLERHHRESTEDTPTSSSHHL